MLPHEREILAALTAIKQELAVMNGRLDVTNQKLEKIAMSQSDIDTVTNQIEGEVTDLNTQDAAILAAQDAFAAEIATLQGQGFNTANLVAAAAQLATAFGANDTDVANLTAASAATPTPAPAPSGS
jgi:septal ring factor EnvC (AmiA/AmiB activator)